MQTDSDTHFENLSFVPKKIVLKLGSAVLTRPQDERIDENLVDDVAQGVSRLFDEGRQAILVSSGAVAAGHGLLHLPTRARSIPEKQALAAIGQSQLMHLYSVHFSRYGRNIAQLLLTRDDMEDRRRYRNTSYTLEKLLALGVVPIINENDTTTIDELRFSDNDILSAIVAAKIKADFLVLLSDVDGLFNCDPHKHPGACLVPRIEKITPEIEAMVVNVRSRVGAGGMSSKLEAARRATDAGTYVCICNGKRRGVLDEVFAGRCPGTLFVPQRSCDLSSRARWIAFGKSGANKWIMVDDGARDALIRGKKSLLAVGIKDIKGEFRRGDVVQIRDGAGNRIGKGLVNYDANEVRKIRGAKSDAIEKILGTKEYDEVIHRDNMIIFPKIRT